jgi:type I restriction enzyme S subunit
VARVEALTRRLDQARQARQAALAEAATVFQRVLEDEFADEVTVDWHEVPAEKLFKIVSGQASPQDPQFKHLPYLGPEHVESGTGRIIGERVSVEKLEMKSGKYVFSPEHVVYSKIRPALRKICLPDYHGLCSADMYALKPNTDEVTREFLLFLLLAPPFSQYAVEKSDRNAMPKINQTALFDFTFRVPDQPEQKRIVRLLLALRGKLDELQRVQREVEAELASFTPALLAKAFRGEL